MWTPKATLRRLAAAVRTRPLSRSLQPLPRLTSALIFTDVDGVYTTDPRIVPEAKRLNSISFEEMLELASAGSKVLQIRSVEFAGKFKVPCRVLSSLTDPDLPGRSRGRLRHPDYL